MTRAVVIVGSGHAGVQAAASLREEGFDGAVAIVSDEAELPYHKPPLSKTFIKDSSAQPQVLRAESFYAAQRIELRLGQRVERIEAGRLALAGGGTVSFDRLILATGARPRTLPVEGTTAGLYALRSVADARAIRDAAAQSEDVVVVGGGFIGLEIAATLRAAGKRVTVLEAQDRLLNRVVAPAISKHVLGRLEGMGVRVLTRAVVSVFEREGGLLTRVSTSTGERIAAQAVIVGIGVVPNAELAEAAGLAVSNGIQVDGSLRSSAPEILAIGDVASYRHFMTGTQVRLESVQNATDQARLAARTVLGHTEAYAAVPWFWSDIGDMKLQMVGLTGGSDRQIVAGDPEANRFSVFHYLGEKIVGIESVNRPADHMLGRRMMAEGFSPDSGLVQDAAALKGAFETWRTSRPEPSTRP